MMGSSELSRMARQVSRPPMPGIFRSSRIRSGGVVPQHFQRFFAGLGFDDGIAEIRQRRLHGAPQLRFVVDDKYGRCVHSTRLHSTAA